MHIWLVRLSFGVSYLLWCYVVRTLYHLVLVYEQQRMHLLLGFYVVLLYADTAFTAFYARYPLHKIVNTSPDWLSTFLTGRILDTLPLVILACSNMTLPPIFILCAFLHILKRTCFSLVLASKKRKAKQLHLPCKFKG